MRLIFCLVLLSAQDRYQIAPSMPVDSYKAVAWGDSQSGVGVFSQICASMRAERPQLVVGLGDYIQNATSQAEWPILFLQPMGTLLAVPRIGTRGNHELPGDFAALVYNIPIVGGVGQWAATTVGNVLWLILDANDDSLGLRLSMDPGGPQRRFLEQTVASPAWRDARWRVAIWHQPCDVSLWYAPVCYYQFYAQPRWREAMNLLASAGCSMVLNGHSHGLSMGAWPTATSPMVWITSGGGGGALDSACPARLPQHDYVESAHHFLAMTFSPERLVVQVKRPDGTMIRQIERLLR